MPTHEESKRFLTQYRALTPEHQAAFGVAVAKLISDLESGRLRKSLCIKPFRGIPGTWEMTWADDGRALFRHGVPVRPGHVHIVWLRIGSHDIFDER